MKKMKSKATEIDVAGFVGFPDTKVENIKQQVDLLVLSVGHGVINDELDRADFEGFSDIKVENIKPRGDLLVLSVGHGVVVL
eukprot:CAMPEP_0195104852 /NCGR_PEP_ID=MMETSP0448-20130528/74003_1 /TAXON_ID=66468 /ORGANISM="Heterocapsa triquestra, Strain CCMP 448" /LENGTH=81 /DNA_ID=CAMNT_0040140775 /DNA_START=1 /DNA_END=242 /DNA_ORIENTATION=-